MLKIKMKGYSEPIQNYINRVKKAMEEVKMQDLTWEEFRLLNTILGKNHHNFIKDILKECKQEPKNLSEDLILEK